MSRIAPKTTVESLKVATEPQPEVSIVTVDVANASGALEVQTVTLPTFAAATNADYFTCENKGGDNYAVYLDKNSVAQVETITFPSFAGATDADYVMLYNTSGTSWAIWLDASSVAEESTITFPATSGATQADYIMFYNEAGTSWAIWLDIDDDGTAPTGALYTGSDNQIEVDIVTGDTAAQVGTKVFTAIGSLVTDVSLTDNLDGTITFTQNNRGDTDAPVPKNGDDVGAGSITVSVGTNGVDATAPTGALYVGSDNQIKVEISSGQTATQVATAAFSSIGSSLTNITIVDNLDGSIEFTQDIREACTDAVPKNANDSGAGAITVSVDIDGVAPTAPTGALYAASDYQIRVPITTGNTAAQVATSTKNAMEANANFTNVTITDDSAGTLTLTSDLLGVVVAPQVKNEDDSGIGSITRTSENYGVLAAVQSTSFNVIDAAGTTHYFWFNSNSEGSDPSETGTGHEVAIAASDSLATVASKLSVVANNVATLNAEVVDSVKVKIDNASTGSATDINDNDSGLTLAIEKQGQAGTYYPSISPASISNNP